MRESAIASVERRLKARQAGSELSQELDRWTALGFRVLRVLEVATIQCDSLQDP
jgi:hypothetical protein